MTPDALAAAARALGVDLAPTAAAALLAYLQAMLDANRQLNLTGIRDPEQAVVLHVLDSLAIGALGLRPRRALDLGSGNGFPGVAVAALWPACGVILMDRTAKKARVLEALAPHIGDNVAVAHLDAAQAPSLLPGARRGLDLITARALGAPAAIAHLAAPLCARDGTLVLWLDATTAAPATLHSFRLRRDFAYDLPEPAARRRRLAVYRRE